MKRESWRVAISLSKCYMFWTNHTCECYRYAFLLRQKTWRLGWTYTRITNTSTTREIFCMSYNMYVYNTVWSQSDRNNNKVWSQSDRNKKIWSQSDRNFWRNTFFSLTHTHTHTQSHIHTVTHTYIYVKYYHPMEYVCWCTTANNTKTCSKYSV